MAVTTFTYGDPKISSATVSARMLFLGFTPTGNIFPVPLDNTMPGGTISSAYSTTVSVVGGTAPYTFSVSSGTLPSSLSLSSSTGVISGTPTVAATSTFSIQVTDTNGLTGATSFSITISTASVISGASNYGYAA